MKANDPKIRPTNVCALSVNLQKPERLCFYQKQEKEAEAEALISRRLRAADL